MINLCAGPTTIAPEVKEAMNTFLTNPDMDPDYTKIHRNAEKNFPTPSYQEQKVLLCWEKVSWDWMPRRLHY